MYSFAVATVVYSNFPKTNERQKERTAKRAQSKRAIIINIIIISIIINIVIIIIINNVIVIIMCVSSHSH